MKRSGTPMETTRHLSAGLALALTASLSVPWSAVSQALPFPTLVGIEAARQGNPLAAYAGLIDLENQYLADPRLRDVYQQVRFMTEEFLGIPAAGVRAMNAIEQLRQRFPPGEAALPAEYAGRDALQVIRAEAARTQLVIWGEEHHLPQTRSLYELMLRELWKLGYRYLAAETFSDSVMRPDFQVPGFSSGVYLRDPVFAQAVRVAIDLGYHLIAYEESGQPPDGDPSFRDRKQAEHLNALVFGRAPDAKVLVLAGRAHAAEAPARDGWTPMASVLKRITGIDPFTVFAVRMGERLTPEEEDPRYRFATARGLLPTPTIFVHRKTGRPLGDDSFDAFVFWPRVRLEQGRPEWLETVLGRRRVALSEELKSGTGLRLVQAFRVGELPTAIPVDQILLGAGGVEPGCLMLPRGSYWARTIDRAGTVLAQAHLKVP